MTGLILLETPQASFRVFVEPVRRLIAIHSGAWNGGSAWLQTVPQPRLHAVLPLRWLGARCVLLLQGIWCVLTHTHAHAHTRARTHTHTHTQAQTHTRAHTHTHKRTHTRARALTCYAHIDVFLFYVDWCCVGISAPVFLRCGD